MRAASALPLTAVALLLWATPTGALVLRHAPTKVTTAVRALHRPHVDILRFRGASFTMDAAESNEQQPALRQRLHDFGEKLKGYFAIKTDKASLAALGGAILLSYGFVSNASYMACLSVAWYLFSSRTGLSPLAPGQKPKFLAIYGGLVLVRDLGLEPQTQAGSC